MLVRDYKPKYNMVKLMAVDKECSKATPLSKNFIHYKAIPNQYMDKEILGYLQKEIGRYCLIFIKE